MYVTRSIESLLRQGLSQFPVSLVTGPRQAGKSTVLRHLLSDYRYITFDDPLIRKLALEDPELLLSSYPAPLIIDEVQYVPSLFPYIKMRVDENRRETGQYILTGSQTFQVMKGVSESLAGRIVIFNLYPLSWEEMTRLEPKRAFDDILCYRQMVRGFYPELFISDAVDTNLWMASYLTTYIERDVRNIKAISDLGRFQSFVSMLATRAGQLLNLNEISKEIGISQPTARDWVSILESTYIIYLLRPYHNNISKRLVKTPKLYFVDTGLLCYLLGIDNEDRLRKASERGHIFENMVIIEGIKRLSATAERSQCYFYRTAGGEEVDLIVDRRGKLNGYEIKFAKTLSRDWASGLEKFQAGHPLNSAYVLSLHEETTPLTSSVQATHWSNILN